MAQTDPYKVLDVSEGATVEEIKKAFRREALRWHPDRNPGNPDAEKRFVCASEAYEILRDPEKRRAFDAGRRGGGWESLFAGGGVEAGFRRGCGGGRGRGCRKGFGRGRGRRGFAKGYEAGGLVLDVVLEPEEAAFGCRRRIELASPGGRRVLEVRLPPGIGAGDTVRLEGLGAEIHLRIQVV